MLHLTGAFSCFTVTIVNALTRASTDSSFHDKRYFQITNYNEKLNVEVRVFYKGIRRKASKALNLKANHPYGPS